jgi:hypothetical protein
MLRGARSASWSGVRASRVERGALLAALEEPCGRLEALAVFLRQLFALRNEWANADRIDIRQCATRPRRIADTENGTDIWGYRTFRAKSGGSIVKGQVDQQPAKSPNARKFPNRQALLQAALHVTTARFCTIRTITPSSAPEEEAVSRRTHLPSGLSRGLDFLIDADWSTQQAFAVFELLSDLRARIWMYGLELHELIREQRSPSAAAARASRPRSWQWRAPC